jgi:hypothetical protein
MFLSATKVRSWRDIVRGTLTISDIAFSGLSRLLYYEISQRDLVRLTIRESNNC